MTFSWIPLNRVILAPWSPVRGMTWPALLLEFVLAVGSTILVSWVSWMAFEQPLLKLKDRFCYEARGTGRAEKSTEAAKLVCSSA